MSLMAVLCLFGPACAFAANGFESEEFPATVEGTLQGEVVFTAGASKANCKVATLNGSLAEPAETLTAHPSYSSCTAFGFAASVTTTGCDLTFHVGSETATSKFAGSADVVCEKEKAIAIVAFTCEVQISSQSGLGAVEYVDFPAGSPKYFTATATLTKVKYTVTKDGLLCPLSGTGAKEDGVLEQAGSVKGSAGGAATGVQVVRPTKLCKVNEAPCDEDNKYQAGTVIEGESTDTTMKIDPDIAGGGGQWHLTISCTKAVMKGATNVPIGNPSIGARVESYSTVTAGVPNCSLGGNACTISYRQPWWQVWITGGAGNARFRTTAKLALVCAQWPISCYYGGRISAPIWGGAPGSIRILGPAILFREAGAPNEASCSATAEFQGIYSLLQPDPVFVAQ